MKNITFEVDNYINEEEIKELVANYISNKKPDNKKQTTSFEVEHYVDIDELKKYVDEFIEKVKNQYLDKNFEYKFNLQDKKINKPKQIKNKVKEEYHPKCEDYRQNDRMW